MSKTLTLTPTAEEVRLAREAYIGAFAGYAGGSGDPDSR